VTTTTATRVAMVIPPYAHVLAPIADLRGAPTHDAELVDQLHYKEIARVLGSRERWLYVQAQDHYFGWIHDDLVEAMPGSQGGRLVGRTLAPIRRAPDTAAEPVGHLPAGTPLASRQIPAAGGGWVWVNVRLGSEREGVLTGYVSLEDAAEIADLPHRSPTAADLVATARSFLGTPYLWGGTSAAGIDCSGFVQQVYRLNGVGLGRDADRQALEGRPADTPLAGDLLFFGSPHVTHVAMSLGDDDFIHAPMRGAFVEERKIAEDRVPVCIRRYLLDTE